MIIQTWKQTSTYVQGKSHFEKNIGCQDRTYSQVKNGIRIIALADGAGSRKHSDIGAEIVCKEISNIVCDMFDTFYELSEKKGIPEDIYNRKILSAKKIILNRLLKSLDDYLINKQDIAIEDLASTLLFFAVKQDKYIYGHLGDGVIGVVFDSIHYLSIDTISHPDNGSEANITYFTTDSNAINHLRLGTGELNNIRGAILMSDGPEEAFYDRFNGLNENVVKLISNFQNIIPKKYGLIIDELLKDSIADISDDDLSLNILYLENIVITNKELDGYQQEILRHLKYETQLIQISHDSYYLSDCPEINDVKEINFTNIIGKLL